MKYFSRLTRAVPNAATLLERWCAQSQGTGWIRESDWFCNAARSVATCVSAGKDPTAALRSLASRRAVQGTGIAESLSDVQALFRVAPHPESNRLIVEFADAWVEATDLFSHRLTCSDATSGLANRQHFERRVHELRENPQTIHDSYVVVLYKHQRLDLEDMESFMLAADIGQACLSSVPEGIGTYHGNKLALLLPRDSVSRAGFGNLGQALTTVLEHYGVPANSLRLDIEPVPHTSAEVQRLLGTLWA